MKLRILIVEDEAVSAADLHDELIAQGYEVTGIADTAADAFRLAEEGGPDLVLMDINLEEPADGIHAALALRSIGIPVIFLTAHYDERTLDRAKRAKPVGFIAKPYKPHDLPIAIEIGIARHRSEAERARLTREIAEAKALLQEHAANLEATVAERTVALQTAIACLTPVRSARRCSNSLRNGPSLESHRRSNISLTRSKNLSRLPILGRPT
jgi:AmiR/NasT family two-component response regulator